MIAAGGEGHDHRDESASGAHILAQVPLELHQGDTACQAGLPVHVHRSATARRVQNGGHGVHPVLSGTQDGGGLSRVVQGQHLLVKEGSAPIVFTPFGFLFIDCAKSGNTYKVTGPWMDLRGRVNMTGGSTCGGCGEPILLLWN